MFLYHEKMIYTKLFSFHWPKVNRENEGALRGTVQTDLEIRPLRGNSKKRVFTFVFPLVSIFRQGILHRSGIIILPWGDRVSELSTCLEINFRRALGLQDYSETFL